MQCLVIAMTLVEFFVVGVFDTSLASQCHVQWFTTCTIGYMVIMYIKINVEWMYNIWVWHKTMHKGMERHTLHLIIDLVGATLPIANERIVKPTHSNCCTQSHCNVCNYNSYMTLELKYSSRASEGESKIVLDNCGCGGAPRATVVHLVYVVHWAIIRT